MDVVLQSHWFRHLHKSLKLFTQAVTASVNGSFISSATIPDMCNLASIFAAPQMAPRCLMAG